MLPLLHNHIYVAISPDRISMIKLKRGLKPMVVAQHDELISSGGLNSWKLVLEKLGQLFAQNEWQGAQVNIVLSNRLVRYATIVFDCKLNSYSAQEAFAKHVFSQIYGNALVATWTIRIQHGEKGSPSLVSAIDNGLLEGLQKICGSHRLKLNSVTPYLSPVFNRFQKLFKRVPFWLVIHEPGYSLVALMSRSEFISINGVNHTGLDELPMLLDRENLVSALPTPCKAVQLFSPSARWQSGVAKLGYEFEWLELATPSGFPLISNGLYALIMSEFLK